MQEKRIQLNDCRNEIKSQSDEINVVFLSVEDVQRLTGFSRKTVQRLFRDPEFPSCDYGKCQIVEAHALIEYFSVPRRKSESRYWLNVA